MVAEAEESDDGLQVVAEAESEPLDWPEVALAEFPPDEAVIPAPDDAVASPPEVAATEPELLLASGSFGRF